MGLALQQYLQAGAPGSTIRYVLQAASYPRTRAEIVVWVLLGLYASVENQYKDGPVWYCSACTKMGVCGTATLVLRWVYMVLPGLYVSVEDESSDAFESNDVGDHLGVKVFSNPRP
eukprot:3180156-Rhodomonas_salina.4